MNNLFAGSNGLFYIITVVTWGSSWIMIDFQLGTVFPILSVFYRFLFAALLLQIICRLQGLQMVFGLYDHAFFTLQEIFLFGMNYWLFYESAEYLESELMALVFSTIVVMNMINTWIWFGQSFERRLMLG